MPESTRDLHIHLDVHIDDGPDWELDRHIPVPPDYTEQDIEPFVLHELDRATAQLELENFGRARAAEIIAQFDLRIRVIAHLLRNAPHPIRRSAVALKVLSVIDLPTEQLFAQYDPDELGN